MLNAIAEGHEEIKKICEFINSIVAEIGKEKFTYESADVPEEIFEAVKEYGWDRMREAVLSKDKEVRDANVAVLQEEVAAMLEEKEEGLSKWAPDAIYKLEKKVVRDYLFREHVRVDGRALDEIRPLSCAVGVLPRVHGSSFFQRGHFLSSGIAYTLQIMAQKDADPTSATLIMSLESVFAVLSGWLVLGEALSGRELIGCLFVFIAVILAQIQLPLPKKKKSNEK